MKEKFKNWALNVSIREDQDFMKIVIKHMKKTGRTRSRVIRDIVREWQRFNDLGFKIVEKK